jgi:hypothetical protein
VLAMNRELGPLRPSYVTWLVGDASVGISPDSSKGMGSVKYTNHVFASSALLCPADAKLSTNEQGGRVSVGHGRAGENNAVWVRCLLRNYPALGQ